MKKVVIIFVLFYSVVYSQWTTEIKTDDFTDDKISRLYVFEGSGDGDYLAVFSGKDYTLITLEFGKMSFVLLDDEVEVTYRMDKKKAVKTIGSGGNSVGLFVSGYNDKEMKIFLKELLESQKLLIGIKEMGGSYSKYEFDISGLKNELSNNDFSGLHIDTIIKEIM